MSKHRLVAQSAILLVLAVILCSDSVFAGQNGMAAATSLYKKKDYQSALNMFQKLRADGDASAELSMYIAHCYSALGMKKDALKAYQNIEKTFPGNPAATLAAQCIMGLESASRAVVPGGSATKGRASMKATVSPILPIPGADSEATLSMPPEERVPYTRRTGGHLYVKGEINGRGTEILFDTGAFRVVIGRDNLIALGITPPVGQPRIVGSGAAGPLRGWEMVLDISVGRVKRRMPVLVLNAQQDMLLGQPFLQGIHYQIDNNANYIVFTKDSESFRRGMSYDAVEVPCRMIGGNCMVLAKVNGSPTQMNFDTGAPCTVFSGSAIGEFGLQVVGPTRIGGAGGSTSIAYECIADTIELGPLRKQQLRVLVSPSCGQNVLGQDFFGRMRYIVDNEKQVIRIAR